MPKVEIKEFNSSFIPVIRTKTKQMDLNYYGIRQKMLKILKIDTFKKIKPNIKKKEPFDYKKYYEDMNVCILDYWNRFCIWWDKIW